MTRVLTPSHMIRTRVAACLLGFVIVLLAPHQVFAGPKGPVLDRVTPPVAAPGQTVTFEGHDFGLASPTSFVIFNGVRATTTSWSDTRVTAIVPPKSVAGYAGIVADNISSNGVWFAPTGRPQVTAISPSLAPPGSTVSIMGRGFGSMQRNGRVTFGGVPATVVFWSDTRITAVVPELSNACYAGVWQNGAPSNGWLFTPYPAPLVTSLSRSLVRPNDTVTINGSNFGTSGELTLGGVLIPTATWSRNAITFVVPADMDSGYLGVWRGDVCSNGAWLGIASHIDSVKCAESSASWWGPPGGSLTIRGTGFGAVTGKVSIGKTPCTVTEWTDTRITVTVPAEGTEGYLGVWRANTASNGVWFLSQYGASVLSCGPDTVAPGEMVTITGNHFGATQGKSLVRLHGVELPVVSWSDTQIVAAIPAGASSGYVGVWKRGAASNGKYLSVTTP